MGNRAVKEAKIDEMRDEICRSSVAIVTDYRGLTVEEITTLRRSLQETDAEYSVVKNTLAKIAVKDTQYEALDRFFKGPTALVLGRSDQVGPAKALSQFIKKAKKVTIKGGLMEGNLLDEAQVKNLADLPTIEELYSKILSGLKSPATGLAMGISGVARSLAIVISEMSKQKEA